jgi:hypothetical protein
MEQNPLIGTWKLVSSEFRRSDGSVFYPYGPDAMGVVNYDAAGDVAVQLMRADRPAFASGDMYGGSPEEIKAAFEGMITYFGRYEVDHEKGVVTHHIHGCSFPNWIGGEQVRFFAGSGNRLTVSTPPILAGGSTMTGVLVWERIA